MISTDNIYYNVGQKLLKRNFQNQDLHTKKQILNEELIRYTKQKLRELKIKYVPINEEESLEEMLELIDPFIINKKEDFFRHYTHFILSVVGELQLYSVTWWSINEGEPVSKPLIEPSEDGPWDSLTTYKGMNPIEVTKYVFNTFMKSYSKSEIVPGKIKKISI